MGIYNITNQKSNKNLSIKLGGVFSPADVENFMKDFKKELITINPIEYDITFDSNELQVSPQEMLPLLENCFHMYKEIGFKKVNINIGNSPILKMQIKRVANKIGLNFEIL
ncbi:MAG: hypothetical protein K0R15_1747 [Clostridiales bacterium]|jgi:hypothetical protein|nr:hypothetical protein [Clostridiales bacterium]